MKPKEKLKAQLKEQQQVITGLGLRLQAAWAEQQAAVATLEAQIDALKHENAALKSALCAKV